MKQKLWKKVMSLVLIGAVFGSLAACDGSNKSADTEKKETVKEEAETETTDTGDDSEETIKIAAFYNMSGANADTGVRDKEGTDLAVKMINEAGGIKALGGRKLEIVYGDTLSDTAQAKAVAERVLASGDIVAAVGVGGSAYAAPQLPIFEKNKIPYLLFGTAASLTEQGYSYVFRVSSYGGENGLFGKAMVDFLSWMQEEQGIDTSKVAIIYENSDYGISLAESNREQVEEAGFDVVYEESYPIGLTDASSLVANCKSNGAQAVFVSSFPQECKLITSAMKSIDYSPIVVGGGGGFLFPEYANTMGDDVEGSVSVAITNFDCQTVVNSDYSDVPALYEETYGTFMCEHSVCSYNNIIILADALERAGSTDGEALAKALRETNIETLQPAGAIEFDEVGNNVNAVPVVVQWQRRESDQTFVPVTIWPESEASAEFVPIG